MDILFLIIITELQHFKLYLTITGIIIQMLKQWDTSDVPKKGYGPILISKASFFKNHQTIFLLFEVIVK